jgi:hypothetical protein
MKFLAAFLALLLATGPASALEWKTQHLSLKAAPLDRTAETAFEFTNQGDKTVTIKSVDTSCDCLEAHPSAKTFAPGASGTINARFTLGDRVGKYGRTIIVSTDEGQEATALTVEIEVPEVVTLSPRVVDWKLHEAATGQTITLDVTPGVDLTFGDVQATSEDFAFRLEKVSAVRAVLHLSPKDIAKPANAAFRIHAKTAAGQELVFSAYANVR